MAIAIAGGATAGTMTSRLRPRIARPSSSTTADAVASTYHTLGISPPIVAVVTVAAPETVNNPGFEAVA